VTDAEEPEGALEGLKVVEIAEGISGPYCGKLLADLGAEVIKVERPGAGDASRGFAPFYHDEPSPDAGLLFGFLNTSKLGVTLDVAAPPGREILHRLLAEADVVLVGGRPAAIERAGLDYASLSEAHAGLVCTYVTPFGLTGPHAGWQGSELVAFQASGLGIMTPAERRGSPEMRPLKAGGHQAMMVAGLTAAVATMHAVFAREASGAGQCVDVSEVEPLTSHQFLNLARWTYTGDPGYRGYTEGSGRIWCRDGAVFMLLFAGQGHQWQAFLDLMGNPEWAQGPEYRSRASLGEKTEEFWARVHEWAGGYGKQELYREAQGRRVPMFPENSIAEAVESEQVRARGFVQEIPLACGASVRAPTAPYQFSETPVRVRRVAPSLGRDNDAVFRGRLGLTAEELRRAREAGVV